MALCGHFRQSRRWAQLCGLLGVAIACNFGSGAAQGADPPVEPEVGPVIYQTDIRPILSSRCYKCHGPMVQRGGLRLDEHDLAAKGGTSGMPILAPSAESELYRRISSTNAEDRMPLGGAIVPSDEMRLIQRWLDEGARWPEIAKVDQQSTDFWRRVDRLTFAVEDIYNLERSLAPVLVVLLVAMLVIERGKRFHKQNPRWAGTRSRYFFALCQKISVGWYVASVLVLVVIGSLRFNNETVRQRDNWMSLATAQQATPMPAGSVPGHPRPFRPLHPRRIGGLYYRGNDERNVKLFNGGFYRTATFSLSLVDGAERTIQSGDEVPDGKLSIRLEIRRAPAAAPRLFADDIMGRAGLSVVASPTADDKEQPIKFQVIETGERWAAEFPIGQTDGKSELKLDGLVYLLDGNSPHYGIQYDLHFQDGRLQNDSELWMGAIMLTANVRVPAAGTVPLSEWFDFREIPEIEGENSTDEILLGTPEHVGYGSAKPGDKLPPSTDSPANDASHPGEAEPASKEPAPK